MQKNGCMKVGNTDMYYVTFGEGKRILQFYQDCLTDYGQ